MILRALRYLWPVLFFIPLPAFAGRYCWLAGIDPVYHALVFTHEYMPQILLGYALLSIAAVLRAHLRARRNLRHLASLAIPTPPSIAALLLDESGRLALRAPACMYLDVAQRFCFTSTAAPGLVVSRGFAMALSAEQLRLALRHELVHLKRAHPLRALGWRIVRQGLLVPGFEALERGRYVRREEAADRESAAGAVRDYGDALRACAAPAQHAAGALTARRLDALAGVSRAADFPWSAAAAGLLVALLAASHVAFMERLPFFLTHHC